MHPDRNGLGERNGRGGLLAGSGDPFAASASNGEAFAIEPLRAIPTRSAASL